MSRRKRRAASRLEQQREADARWVLSDPRGRRFVQQRIVDDSGFGVVSAMTGNSHTFYNLGRFDFVGKLLNDLRAVSLQLVRDMEDEANTERERAALDAQDEQENPDSDG